MPATRGFQFIAGSLALDLVNTVGNRLGELDEYLVQPADFERWTRLARRHSTLGPTRVTARQLAHIRQIREELYRLFRPRAGRTPTVSQSALRPLNREIKRLARDWHLDHRLEQVSWTWASPRSGPDGVLAQVVADAARLLTSGAFRFIRQCQGDECGWLFLDRSRQGNRRWCSMVDCGNRAKARRFYQHHRPGPETMRSPHA